MTGILFPQCMFSSFILESHDIQQWKSFRSKVRAGNLVKSMTSEGNSALLPENVDRRLSLHVNRMWSKVEWHLKHWGIYRLMDLYVIYQWFFYLFFHCSFWCLRWVCNKSLDDWPIGKQITFFLLNLNVSLGSLLENKIKTRPVFREK